MENLKQTTSPNPSKEQLQSRLHDQGFSHFTMPSVARPRNALSQHKPLVARLYSLNNNLIREAKQPQTSILFNTPAQANMPLAEFELSRLNQLEGNATTRGVLRTSSVAPGRQTAFSSSSSSQANARRSVFPPAQNALLPASTLPLSEESEVKQARVVLDKLRSGFLDRMRFCGRELQRAQSVERPLDRLAPALKDSLMRGGNFMVANATSNGDCALEGDRPSRVGQKELDLYINLIMTNNTNVDEFVYLIKNPENDDPYDLILKTYFQIQAMYKKPIKKGGKKRTLDSNHANEPKEERKVEDYYTISMKGLCHFRDGKPVEFISLPEWLKERDIFDKIKQLSFFANFRKWKTVKMWSKSYKSFKQKVARRSLENKLLINCPEIRESIVQTRRVLFDLSQLKMLDFGSPHDNGNEVTDMDTFTSQQDSKAQQMRIHIQSYSREAHELVNAAVESRLQALRNEIGHTSDADRFKKAGGVNNSTNAHQQESPYEALAFPENMSYDKRSVLRKECHRFVRYSYLVDLMAQDALRTIFLKSTRLLLDELQELSLETEPVVVRELDKGRPLGSREPLFALEVEPNLNYRSLENALRVEQVEVQDYKFPQVTGEEDLKPENFENYNLITYPFVINYDIIDEFSEQQKKYLEYCDPRTFVQKTAVNLEQVALTIMPNLDIFLQQLNDTVRNGFSALYAFQSFVQNPNMRKYTAVLEEWEEKNEEAQDQVENACLDPEECVDGEERSEVEQALRRLFEEQFDRASNYLSEFQPFLQADWEYHQTNVDNLVHRNLAKPAQTLTAVFQLLDYQQGIFDGQIPFQADLGVFRIISKNLKTTLLEKPKAVKEKLSKALVEEISSRVVLLKQWFEDSINQLKVKATDIEMFVQQTKSLKEIEKKIAFYKDLLKTTHEVIDTVKRFQVDIKKETILIFSECKILDQNLSQLLVQINDGVAKNQEIFSMDIRTQSIPALMKEITVLEQSLANPRFLDIRSKNVLPELKELEITLDSLRSRSKQLNSFEEVLSLPRTRFEGISSLTETLISRILIWKSYQEWFTLVEQWRNMPMLSIVQEDVKVAVDKYSKQVARCRKNIPAGNQMVQLLDGDIKGFAAVLPILGALTTPKLTRGHLQEIEGKTGLALEPENLKLADLLSEQVLEHQGAIIEAAVQVVQEGSLKSVFAEVETKFAELTFPLRPFKEDSPKDSTYILGDCEPILAEVDRLILQINNLYGSRYLKELKKVVADKRKDILQLQEFLIEWIKFQKSYIYLESIFAQPEIKKPLQIEVKEFEDTINKPYKQIVKKVVVIQSIALLTKQKHIEQAVPAFKKFNDTLNELNKKLNNFLDSKREAFPRFYFVSNDELVYILANYDSPTAVQTFLGKLFENVHKADFGSDPRSVSIQSIVSREGEVLPLKSTINIKSDAVEKWMKKLEDLMSESLFKTIKEGLASYAELPRAEWYGATSAQPLSVITQLAWTLNVEEYFRAVEREEDDNFGIADVMSETVKNLETLVARVRGTLSFAQHQATVALITIEVHNRDILEELSKRNVCAISDFSWQQQLRFYFDEGADWRSTLSVAQIGAKQRYGFEYYGPCARLVVTPLTDRCWITITSALQMKLGAAPAGPAGTGKTESVKDLAKALARFCVVFNCSDQIDYMMMEKLFRGVIKQGAWACLDEFNRIDIEVLSVAAQQLLELRLALLQLPNESEFLFCGARCRLNDTCGVFITMNPGYAGRTELPENLKALFRPISMMIPDYALIAQILLFAEGFAESKVLSSKMIKLYKLASEQLSQQRHYDFGMRAVKCVLEMAGKLKRSSPDENESALLIRALKDANLPKFLKDDLPLFNGLLNDLFPGCKGADDNNQLLRDKCYLSLESRGYQTPPNLMEKIMQFSSTLKVRFGTMLVGSAMSGKSTVLNTLYESINALYNSTEISDAQKPLQVSCVMINPKAVTMGELYGEENPLTKDWSDGLGSFYMRQAALSTEPGQSWICFDGPVDAIWIENMNSVLDDSRLLCLANGQRIRLRADMRILFEVDNLEQASPATVSRCGMVFLSEETLGWQSFVRTWLASLLVKKTSQNQSFISEQIQATFETLFNATFETFIEMFKNSNKPIDSVAFQAVQSTLNSLEVLLSEEFGFKPAANDDYKTSYINLAFPLACSWGFAAGLQDRESERFDSLIKKRFPALTFPPDLLINCFLDPETVELRLFSEQLEKTPVEISYPLWEVVVPTVDTAKLTAIASWHLKLGRNVFLTGATGTGKSVLASSLLKQLSNTNTFDTFKYNFSAQTNSATLQDSILSSLFLLSQKARGARAQRRNIIHIDDVNMPAREQFGAQPPIELLRQLVDTGYLYERKEMFKITVQDTALMCLAAPPEGGRNPLSTRFVRHFNLLCFPKPRSATISRIFNTLMDFFTVPFEEPVRAISHELVNASIELYDRITKEKLPTPSKFFYTFNLRDLSKMFMGLTRASPSLIRDAKQISHLWIHETSRVFYDRLCTSEDKEWFAKTLSGITDSHLRLKTEPEEIQAIQFTDLLTLNDEEIFYEEIVERNKLIKALEDGLEDYNSENAAKMQLVFFDGAIEHILRIHRILMQPRGSAMLIGLGGLGKSATVRLASFLAQQPLVSLESAKNLAGDKFKEWLRKNVLLRAGGPDSGMEGMPLTLLVAESSLPSGEQLFEDINNLLNSGEVPNIFPRDEKEKLEKGLCDLFATKNIIIETSEAWKLFVERVRNNLHIVLCMSPVGDTLRVRCRKFPALVDCCTLDWFDSWPGPAIEAVAQKLILNQNIPEPTSLVCRLFREFHESVETTAARFVRETKRSYFVTPKSTLDNIIQFTELYKSRQETHLASQNIFQKGSVKLAEMGEIVRNLKIELTEAQPLLEEQKTLTEKKLVELEAASKIANEKRGKVEIEAQAIQLKSEQIEVINNQASEQLAEAMPLVARLENEARNFDKKEIHILKSFKTPPESINFIFATVCVALEEKFVDWKNTGLRLLNDTKMFEEMLINKIVGVKTQGASIVPPSVITHIAKNLKNDFFSDAKIGDSKTARTLANWCKGFHDFVVLKRQVEPLEKNAKELSEKLAEAKQEYDVISAELAECCAVLDNLQTDFNALESRKMELEHNILETGLKLGRAEKLVFLLADEAERWKQTVAELALSSQNILGDSFLASAHISYMGPLTASYRTSLEHEWIELIKEASLPFSPGFNFLTVAGDPLTLKDWTRAGLPSDNSSQSSALAAILSLKWPLLIDPQLQAGIWLKNTFDGPDLQVCRPDTDSRALLNKIKNAVTNGLILLFEETPESLEPLLDPLLSRQQFKNESENRWVIALGEELIDYNPAFRLFLTCKLANPLLPPEAFIKANVINFTVNLQGLEDQLLAEVVQIENAALEATKTDNIEKIGNYKKKMAEIESQILKLLVECEQSPVEDENLVQTLEISKVTAREISEKMEEVEKIAKQVEETRNTYRPIAIRGAVLFFVVSDIGAIDPMYQYSLQYIVKLFRSAISQTTESDPDLRADALLLAITQIIYKNVSRGLFERHKPVFSFLIAIALELNSGRLAPGKWERFLKGADASSKAQVAENPDVRVFPEEAWELSRVLAAENESWSLLLTDFSKNIAYWKKFLLCNDPFTIELPEHVSEKIDLFDRLLLVKLLRPERLFQTLTSYVGELMGKFFVEASEGGMESIYADSDCMTPIIFVISQGADPANLVKKLGEEKGFELYKKLLPISLGQGQGKRAAGLIYQGMEEGLWIFLENCHLARTWMPELERIVGDIQSQKREIHPEFRLLLTSMPADYFPISVLQNGIKITTEPPRGVKANLIRSVQALKDEAFENNDCPEALGKLTAGLCVFHALIQERRKFGPLGWNIRYEFNDSDLATGQSILTSFLAGVTNKAEIPWESINFLVGPITYGGRITDDIDRRLLLNILSKFFTDAALEDRYKFCSLDEYRIPRITSRRALLEYAEGLSAFDSPELFGMHRNASITYQSQETAKLIDTIVSVLPKSAAGGGAELLTGRVLELIAAFNNPQSGLPAFLAPETGHKDLFKLEDNGLLPSLSTVLLQEVQRFNKLLARIQSSLAELELAVQGKNVMSAELDEVFNSLLANQVPRLWAELAYPSLKPLASWFRNLRQRVDFMAGWLAEGQPASRHFWLPGFFFPQGFLTGVLQTHARKLALPIDKFLFTFKVVEAGGEAGGAGLAPPDAGVYVSGLFLEAAAWDRKRKMIVDQAPGELHHAMPLIWFCPRETSDAKGQVYSCPLYKTLLRAGTLSTTGQSTNFVLEVQLPCDKNADVWTLRGVALFTELNN